MGLIFQNTEKNKIGDGLITVPDGTKDSTAIIYNSNSTPSTGSFSFIADECDLCKNITFSIWGKLCRPYNEIISMQNNINIDLLTEKNYSIGVKFTSYSEESGFVEELLGMVAIKLTNEWQRFQKTITFKENYSGKIKITLLFRSKFSTEFSALLYKSQLEVGDIATGWRASPNDILQEAIASATSSVESNLFDYQDGLRKVYFFKNVAPFADGENKGSGATENQNAANWNSTLKDYWFDIIGDTYETSKLYEKTKLQASVGDDFTTTYKEIDNDNLKEILYLIPKKSYYQDGVVNTYVQGNDPTSSGLDTGDLWVKTLNNEYGLYIYSKGTGSWNPIGINFRLLHLTDFSDGKTTIYGLGFDANNTSSQTFSFNPTGIAVNDYCLERIVKPNTSPIEYDYLLYKRVTLTTWKQMTDTDITSILKLYTEADTSDGKVVWVYAPSDGSNVRPDLSDTTYQEGDCWINKANNGIYTYKADTTEWVPLDSYLISENADEIEIRPLKTIILYSLNEKGSSPSTIAPINYDEYYTCTASLYSLTYTGTENIYTDNNGNSYKIIYGDWVKIVVTTSALKNHYTWSIEKGAEIITTDEDDNAVSTITLGNGEVKINADTKNDADAYSKFTSNSVQFGNYRLMKCTSYDSTYIKNGLMFVYYEEE